MPEGPSIVILRELVQSFKGQSILAASGNTKIDTSVLINKPIIDFKSWGKHFLILLPNLTLRVHFLLFGSYSINEKTKANPRLHLHFKNGDFYLYTCAIKVLEGDLNEVYDWSADVLNDSWDPKKARKKLKEIPKTLVCDDLLDQNIFAGVGNIIKNEVLFRIHLHPGSKVGNLPPRKLTALIQEARNYSFDFLKWKKVYELKKHYLIYNKKTCPRCNIPLHRKDLGKTKRKTFWCNQCQVKY
jgi:endonuclease-8